MKKEVKQTSFDSWFSANYQQLREKVIPSNLFGEIYNSVCEDVFHDSYLICREIASGNDEKVYFTLFLATYKRQSKIRYNAESKEVRPNDLFWAFLRVDDNESESEEMKAKKDTFIHKLLKCAKLSFSASEFEVFEYYFKLNLGLTNIADVYGCTPAAISYRIDKMTSFLCAKFEDELKAL